MKYNSIERYRLYQRNENLEIVLENKIAGVMEQRDNASIVADDMPTHGAYLLLCSTIFCKRYSRVIHTFQDHNI